MKRPNKGWLTTLAGLCALAATVALLYAPALKFDMFSDDLTFYGPKPLGRAFLAYFLHGQRPSVSAPAMYYRPMSDFLWALYFALFGDKLYLYHAWAIFVHFLNALLVWLCARRLLLLERKWAIAGGLIFSVFWFNFDAVAWVAANDTALCATFIMLSSLSAAAYFRGGGALPLALLSCCALLAVFTKEFALILPLLTAVLWLFPFNSDQGSKRIRLITAISVTLAAVGVYMFARCNLGFPVLPPGTSIPNALATACKWPGLLLGPSEHFSMSLVGMVLFLGAVILKRTRPLAIWVAIALLPAVSKGTDPRYGYIGSVGLALLIATLLEESARANETSERIAARAWLGVFAVIAWAELLSVNGDSAPWLSLSAAAMLAVLLFVLAKGWIERPKFLSMLIAGLIALASFGNAADFPWPFLVFAEVRPLAEKVAAVLPHSGAFHNLVFERNLLDGQRRAVPVNALKPYILLISGEDVRASDIGDFYQSLARGDSPATAEIIFLRQRGDRIERMRDVERLLSEKAKLYGTPAPPDLNLDITQSDSAGSPAFRLCAPPEKGMAWLDLSSCPLNPVAYDLVSIDFSNVGGPPSVRVWLELYPAGSEQAAQRCSTELKGSHATFELRKNIDWLIAGPIGRLLLGTDEKSISLHPTAARIARQPLIVPGAALPSLKPISNFDYSRRRAAGTEIH